MRRKAFHVLILLGAALLWSPSALAEYCWMVGCKGTIAYVYIPWSQLADETPDHDQTIKLNTVIYKFDHSKRLLTRSGLPAVGDVVTLNGYAFLLSRSQLDEEFIQAEIKKSAYIFNKETLEASLYSYDFGWNASKMRPGASLKILSYLGEAAYGRSSLFALVRVESD